MRVQALRTEGGFFIPINEALKDIRQDRIVLEIRVIRPSGFWKSLTVFRESAEKEGIVFSDSDFEGLRDKSKGRKEINW